MDYQFNESKSSVSIMSAGPVTGSSLLFELGDVLYGGDSTKEEINNENCFNYLSIKLALADTFIGKYIPLDSLSLSFSTDYCV